MNVAMNAYKPTLLLANAIKEQITAVTVAPLIADSQAMVSVSEAAARASQLKVDF